MAIEYYLACMINLAIQVLPLHQNSPSAAYAIVDEAIAIIEKSGLKFQVCPFETVIEGEYKEVMEVVKNIHNQLLTTPDRHLLINMKLQSNSNNQVSISDKMAQYS